MEVLKNEYESQLVSFITPAHGDPDGFRKSVESSLSQTDDNYDIWISIDGDSQETVEVAREFYESTDIVHLIIGEKRVGPSVARNRALEETNAKYAALCDTDDYSTEDRLEKQLPVIERDGVSFVGDFMSNCKVDDGNEYKYRNQDLTTFNYFAMSSLLVPTTIRYRPKFKYGELYDIQLLMLSELDGEPRATPNVCRKEMKNGGLNNHPVDYMKWRNVAIQFYHEREENGDDSYDDWTPQFRSSFWTIPTEDNN